MNRCRENLPTKCSITILMLAWSTLVLFAETRGHSITLTQRTSLADIIDHFSDFEGKDVLCLVQVEKVCQQNGCWMSVRQGEIQMLVTFKDYGFFVPKDLADRNVLIQGRVLRQLVSVEEQRHYRKDEGGSAAEIEQIDQPKIAFRFVATGVSY